MNKFYENNLNRINNESNIGIEYASEQYYNLNENNYNSLDDIFSHPTYAKIWNNSLNIFINNENSLIESYKKNRRLDNPWFTILIICYSMLILFGTIGNTLVVSAVVRKPCMRTARNLFIINLAISDLLLCVITMPLTLMEILSIYWPLPSNLLLCKIVGSLQAVSVFVDIISITSIALDRYQVIVYPTNHSLQRLGTVLVLVGIWTLSCMLAAPLFIWRTLKHLELDFPAIGLNGVNYCIEEWPTEHGRAYYSIFTIIFQYIVPVTIITFAYLGICKKLKYRMKPGSRAISTVNTAYSDSNAGGSLEVSNRINAGRDNRRVRRTNILLISIAVIFGISWMPLNVLNVITDLEFPFKENKTYFIIYAMCHMAGMSSACSNPLLYGWLNENFRKEFKEIWTSFRSCCFGRKEVNTIPSRNSNPQSIRSKNTEKNDRSQGNIVYYKKVKSDSAIEDGDVEQSTLITQVLK